MDMLAFFISALLFATYSTSLSVGKFTRQLRQEDVFPPPLPEPIEVREVPLPPVAPTNDTGACTYAINPRRTGCIGKTLELRSGSFLPDNNHIVASVQFSGAPASPDPASIYEGIQLIIIRINGTKFPNGDAWKCITCGVSIANINGDLLEYPQAFKDGQRVLAGNNIVDGGALLASPESTSNTTHIYPIRFNTSANASAAGGSFREVRLHHDNVHIGFSAYSFAGGSIGEFAYYGRLTFAGAPTSGLPMVPRYDITSVNRLYNADSPQQITANGSQMSIDYDAISIGELRGFSGQGDEIIYVGANQESDNFDLFAVHITKGDVRRLTQHPGYTDPADMSSDDQWFVILDTRGTNRTEFMSGLRHVPPLNDLVASSAAASIRNNGQRRFFQPWLLDRAGDRGTYFGQKINAEGDGSPGSINDPLWNAQADPRWSWDQTKISYYQALTVTPACGGPNPLPCPISTADGGRTYRIMIANLTTRAPIQSQAVPVAPDVIPWATMYTPGSDDPVREVLPAGNYTLKGKVDGTAEVTLLGSGTGSSLRRVIVTYTGFTDDGVNVLDGCEDVSVTVQSSTLNEVDWYSNLTLVTGLDRRLLGTKVTGSDGFHLRIDLMTTVFEANGTLTTTWDGATYVQPADYT